MTFKKWAQDGVNWAKQLPLYQRILNDDPKEVIAHKTPFEIFYALRNTKYLNEIL